MSGVGRRAQLIFRALVVLDEAAEASAEGPLPPSHGVRLALMVLFAMSDGQREAYDRFWSNLQDPLTSQNETGQRYLRPTHGRTYLTSIARSVGIEIDVDYLLELRIARMTPAERRAKRADDARLAEHRRCLAEGGENSEAIKAESRRIAEAGKPKRDCGWL